MSHFERSHLQAMAEGIRLFNAQKYWECHEELEDHWREEPNLVRNVYWAVIQVAAAMIHYREGNLTGARGLISKAKQKFERCQQYKIENEIMEHNLSWGHLKQLVLKVPREPELSDFKELFDFKFKDPKEWN